MDKAIDEMAFDYGSDYRGGDIILRKIENGWTVKYFDIRDSEKCFYELRDAFQFICDFVSPGCCEKHPKGFVQIITEALSEKKEKK